MNNKSARRFLLKLLGLAFSVVPVLSAILLYFPIWRQRSGAAMLSGFTLLLIAVSFVPLFKFIKQILRSPSAHTMWFIIFIAFFLLSKIAAEMTVISFVGFIGNLIGALFFAAAKRKDYNGEPRDEG